MHEKARPITRAEPHFFGKSTIGHDQARPDTTKHTKIRLRQNGPTWPDTIGRESEPCFELFIPARHDE